MWPTTDPADRPHSIEEPLLHGARSHTSKLQPAEPDWLFRWARPPLVEGRVTLRHLWLLPADGRDVPWADKVLQETMHAKRNSSLMAIICFGYWRAMIPAVFYKVVSDLLKYVPPLLLSQLLHLLSGVHVVAQAAQETESPEVFEPEKKDLAYRAYMLAVLLPVASLLQAILVNQYFWHTLRLGALVRAALAAAVCRRSIRIALCEKVDTGLLCNLMSSDGARVSAVCGSLNMIWSAPFQLVIAFVMLWQTLGPPVLGGIAIMLAMLPTQAWISQHIAKRRLCTAAATDQRLRRAEAMLVAMPAVKVQRWEALCAAEVECARDVELKALRAEARVKAISVLLSTLAPTVVSLATFTVLTVSGRPLRPPAVFSALALFNAMRAPLSALPDLFSTLAHTRVALARFSQALSEAGGPLLPQPANSIFIRTSSLESFSDDGGPWADPLRGIPVNAVAAMSGASFTWRKDSMKTPSAAGATALTSPDDSDSDESSLGDMPTIALRRVTLQARRGQLLTVIGGMASGKSTLIAALLGELNRVRGESGRAPDIRIGYSGQEVYLTRGTVRENVLFGRPYDSQKYRSSLDACALRADIAAWPDGDQTQIGDIGEALSGGQRARVALARAIYDRPDLCLLDEPLAALDPQMCADIWRDTMRGVLRSSAVVLSTSSIHLAMGADRVVVLERGTMVQNGSPIQLLKKQGLFSEWAEEADKEAEKETEPDRPKGMKRVASCELGNVMSMKHSPSCFSPDEVKDVPLPRDVVEELNAAVDAGMGGGKRVDPQVYISYAMAFGGNGVIFCLSVVMFFAAQASLVLADVWLAHWSSLSAESQGAGRNLGGFALLAMLAMAAVTLQAYMWPWLCLRASSEIHHKSLQRVLHAPLGLPLTSNSGQLLSRFSRDVDTLDSKLPAMMSQALSCFAGLFSSLTTIVLSSHPAIPVVILVAVAFRQIVKAYRPIAAEATRLITVLHGPLVAHLLEYARGRQYVRAFGQQERIARRALALVESGARAQILSVALQRWFALQLEFLGAITLLCVALLSVSTRKSLGMSGLSLTYALTLTALAKYLVNYGTRADAQFVSVERLEALLRLRLEEEHREEDSEGSTPAPPPGWPSKGLLVLSAYQPVAYAPGRKSFLQPLTLTVQPGGHVALIGRSGSGKSTLLAGLTRLLPVGSGRLSLDGWDTTQVKLAHWREAFQCIPQQPLLLAGSVKQNLDPHSQFSEERCWEALRSAGLGGVMRDLPQKLDTQLLALSGEQTQLSAGQKQLLVLARLLLRRQSARLVLLDEPAAGLEQQDAVHLQMVLHDQLPGTATAITVTHRILPVLHNFTRVLIFSEGNLLEDGTPDELLVKGQLQELFAQAPQRVQAHVKRMMALQRLHSNGLAKPLLRTMSFSSGVHEDGLEREHSPRPAPDGEGAAFPGSQNAAFPGSQLIDIL